MKSKLITLSTAAALALAAGCSTPATYVDPSSSRVIADVGSINIQDFAKAADEMTQSLIDQMISSGKLRSGVEGEPAVLAISRITNKTGSNFDTDQLTKKIRVALNRTQQIVTTTTVGLGNEPEDPLAASNQKAKEFFEDKAHTRLPDYTLSGKIIQENSRAGSIRQSAFIFQLSLTSSSGLAVWEDEKTIVKQGNRSSVGF